MVLPGHPLIPLGVSFEPRLQAYWLPPEGGFPPTEGSNTGGSSEYQMAAYHHCSQMVSGSYYRSLPQCHHPALCSTKNAPTRGTRYPWGRLSPGFPPLDDHLTCRSPEDAGLRQQGLLRGGF